MEQDWFALKGFHSNTSASHHLLSSTVHIYNTSHTVINEFRALFLTPWFDKARFWHNRLHGEKKKIIIIGSHAIFSFFAQTNTVNAQWCEE